MGCLTKRDKLVIGKTVQEVEDKIRRFIDPAKTSLQAAQEFGLKLSDYAILHSPTYRSRYAEFLKGDFPHVPLTRNVDLFQRLGELGDRLVNLHLPI